MALCKSSVRRVRRVLGQATNDGTNAGAHSATTATNTGAHFRSA